ncbi:MAG: hypothetical protein CM1200mP30_24050 [Pseudomonadota bacterium]|nr:MAG: hypothetical protein CM1200mP30_24050 [Pseudomonadota bacterium]
MRERGRYGKNCSFVLFLTITTILKTSATWAQIGGGGLMDIGCYFISLARLIFDAEPLRVMGKIEFDPVFKPDRLCSGILVFGQGTSTFTCSTQLVPYQRVNILGTKGRIEIEIPSMPRLSSPEDAPTVQESLKKLSWKYATSTQYRGSFLTCRLNNEKVPTPLEDAVANMKVLEAVIQSAKMKAGASLLS